MFLKKMPGLGLLIPEGDKRHKQIQVLPFGRIVRIPQSLIKMCHFERYF